jgi:hypothetical protein
MMCWRLILMRSSIEGSTRSSLISSLNLVLALAIVFYGTPVRADVSATRADGPESVGQDEVEPLWAKRPSAWILSQARTDDEAARNELSALDARIRDAQLERSRVSTRGPRAAIITGGVLTGVGAGTVVAAVLACASAGSQSGTECRTDRRDTISIVGGAVTGIGLVTLFSGLSAMSKRRQRVREIEQEIRTLQDERESRISDFEARMSFGESTTLTLSWKF